MKILRFIYIIVFALTTVKVSAQYTWQAKQDITGIRYASSFLSIGNKGYAGLGYNGSALNDWYEYDPATNSWTQKATFPGLARWATPSFSINGIGYIISGATFQGLTNSCYAYNPTTNSWSSISPFPGPPRQDACTFVINDKGYVCCGYAGGNLNDLWEFDPTNNSWTQKQNFPGNPRSGLGGFSIDSLGYAGIGYASGINYSDFYSYNPSTNAWTQIANYPGLPRNSGSCFSIYHKGYCGLGYDNSNYFSDFFEYDPITNYWTGIPNFVEKKKSYVFSFVINNTAYVGSGRDENYNYTKDMYSYSVSPLSNETLLDYERIDFNIGYTDNSAILSINNLRDKEYKIEIYTLDGKLIASRDYSYLVSTINLTALLSLSHGNYICVLYSGKTKVSKEFYSN